MASQTIRIMMISRPRQLTIPICNGVIFAARNDVIDGVHGNVVDVIRMMSERL